MKCKFSTGLSHFVLFLIISTCSNSSILLFHKDRPKDPTVAVVDDSLDIQVCQGNSLTPSSYNKCSELKDPSSNQEKTKSVIFTVREDLGNKFVCDHLNKVSGALKKICIKTQSHFILHNKAHKELETVINAGKVKIIMSSRNYSFATKFKVLVFKINEDLHQYFNYLLDINISHKKNLKVLRKFDLIIIQADKSKYLFRTGTKHFIMRLNPSSRERIYKSIKNVKKFLHENLYLQKKSTKNNFGILKRIFKKNKNCKSPNSICKKILNFYSINFKLIKNFFSYNHPIIDMYLDVKHKGNVKVLFEDYKIIFRMVKKVSIKIKKLGNANDRRLKLILGLKESFIINKKLDNIKKKLVAYKQDKNHTLELSLPEVNKKTNTYLNKVNRLLRSIEKIEKVNKIEKSFILDKTSFLNNLATNSIHNFYNEHSRKLSPYSYNGSISGLSLDLPNFLEKSSTKKDEYEDLYYNTENSKDTLSYLEKSVNEQAKGNKKGHIDNLFDKSTVDLYYDNDSSKKDYTADDDFESLLN
jgi:hypothetical protein